jgi:hypothetical protein
MSYQFSVIGYPLPVFSYHFAFRLLPPASCLLTPVS